MEELSAGEVTRLLRDVAGGDSDAVRRLTPLVYEDLRRLAQRQLESERPGHTLQATALVNEAFMRLIDRDGVDWRGRAHFIGVAAKAIRNILVDHARARGRLKRGGGRERVALEVAAGSETPSMLDVLALDEAMERLSTLDERQARIVELRFFGGLSVRETAELLGVSDRTVEGDWAMARAWLRRALDGP